MAAAGGMRAWSDDHPLALGLVVGMVCAAGVAFQRGMWPGFSPAWPLLVLVLLGFRRPLLFQAVAPLPVAMVVAFHARIPVAGLLVPCAAALAAGNMLVASEAARRWGPEHGAFVLVGLAAQLVAGVFCEPVLAVLSRLMHTVGVLLVVVAAVALMTMAALLRGGAGFRASGDGLGTIGRPLP